MSGDIAGVFMAIFSLILLISFPIGIAIIIKKKKDL